MASVGRQLGRLFDVVDILVLAYEASASGSIDAKSADQIQAFKTMREQIEQEKLRRKPEQIIEILKRMQVEDSQAFESVASRLKGWLNSQPNIAENTSGIK